MYIFTFALDIFVYYTNLRLFLLEYTVLVLFKVQLI